MFLVPLLILAGFCIAAEPPVCDNAPGPYAHDCRRVDRHPRSLRDQEVASPPVPRFEEPRHD